jgi:hypothetical protein
MTCPLDDPHDDHDCEEMGRHAEAGSHILRLPGGFLVISRELLVVPTVISPRPTTDTVADPETL